MTYQEIVEEIERMPSYTKKTPLSNTNALLERLGHPERGMKVIHVAGTNGKGSVCAFLSRILQRSGCRVGLFTSPHLTDIRERFCVDGRMVSRRRFSEAWRQVETAVAALMQDGYLHPAYFEYLFAMGLVMFRDAQVEYLVLETGMGGRLDVTNLVESPLLCVITSISIDHTGYLGDSLEEIAGHKAGIIKKGVPVVYTESCPTVRKAVEQEAHEKGSPAFPYAGEEEILHKTDKSIDFLLDYRYDKENCKELHMRLRVPFPAEYQVENASVAAISAALIGGLDGAHTLPADPRVTEETIRRGIAETVWPGRMERILPDVFLDGAHNADGVRAFAQTVRETAGKRSVSLLFSAVSDKEYETMIRQLCEAAVYTHITVTTVGEYRALPADQLAEAFRRYTTSPVTADADPASALETALKHQGDGVLFCAGSLYLAAAVKESIENRRE